DRLVGKRPKPGHGCVLEEGRAAGAGEPLVSRVASIRIGDTGIGLEQAVVLVTEPPLRPAPADLASIQMLEGDPLGRHRPAVVVELDRSHARSDVEAARLRDDPRPTFGLDLRPARVGPPGKTDVVGSVIGVADDPAVVLARAVPVAEGELLQPEDPIAEPSAQPIGGPRADRTEPDDDRVPVIAHGIDPRREEAIAARSSRPA